MPRKRYKPEESEVAGGGCSGSQGQNRVDAIRQIGVSEVTYLSVAPGVRWAEDRAGEAPPEGP
jgi:hypothetical protein